MGINPAPTQTTLYQKRSGGVYPRLDRVPVDLIRSDLDVLFSPAAGHTNSRLNRKRNI